MAETAAKTILFVDDEPRILSAIRRLLRREEWKVLIATSGREGLDLLREQRVDKDRNTFYTGELRYAGD